MVLNGQQQHHVQQLANRRTIGQRFCVRQVEFIPGQLRRRREQLGVIRQVGDYPFKRIQVR